MKWKKTSNRILACILTIAYTVVTAMNIIGPLHANNAGSINKIGPLAAYSIIYYLVALIITWLIYINFRHKPEFLFFTLIILGIILILSGNFLWAITGS